MKPTLTITLKGDAGTSNVTIGHSDRGELEIITMDSTVEVLIGNHQRLIWNFLSAIRDAKEALQRYQPPGGTQ